MKIDRGLYKYGRLQKARDSGYPSPGTSGPFAYEKNILLLLARTPTVEDMERRYPVLAKAERALCLQTETREHETGGDSTALRLNNLGLRQLDSGDVQGAFRSLMDALDHDCGLALAHNNLGLLYLEIGDPSRAIDCLSHATDIQENLDIAYGNMGLAYMELGYQETWGSSYGLSYEHLKRALEIDPRRTHAPQQPGNTVPGTGRTRGQGWSASRKPWKRRPPEDRKTRCTTRTAE